LGFYADQILPRGVNWAMAGKEFRKTRPLATEGLHGEVLELGFGSGLNLPHYPDAVTRILAADPAKVGRKLAAKRLAACPIPVDFVELHDGRLRLPDASVDAILSTWTLCTVPDVQRVLADLRSVMRPGGTLHFLEHGLSPDPKVAKWQHRLNGVQQRFCGGCQLNVAMDEMIRGAGYEIEALDNFHMCGGPKFATYLYSGRARSST